MTNTTPIIPSSEVQFLRLKGDFTEILKLTFPESSLSGWYVFDRTGSENNIFIRKLESSKLIDIITCQTKHLQFDRNLGVLPDSHHYDYRPVGLQNRKEYDTLKEKLCAVNEWR